MLRYFHLFLFLAVGFAPALASAGDRSSSDSDSQSFTRIEVDSEFHEIRFYVEGELAAVLKQDGLHVRESVSYGGSLTDYGTEGFETFAGPTEEESEDVAD